MAINYGKGKNTSNYNLFLIVVVPLDVEHKQSPTQEKNIGMAQSRD